MKNIRPTATYLTVISGFNGPGIKKKVFFKKKSYVNEKKNNNKNYPS